MAPRWFLFALFLLSLPLTAATQTRNNPRTNRPRPRRGRPAVTAPAGPSAERLQALTTGVHQSGVIPRCWNSYLRNAGDNSVSARFRVRVSIDDTGNVTEAIVLDPTPETLASCVRSQLRSVHLSAGTAATIQSTYSFIAGAPAPVPIAPTTDPDAGTADASASPQAPSTPSM